MHPHEDDQGAGKAGERLVIRLRHLLRPFRQAGCRQHRHRTAQSPVGDRNARCSRSRKGGGNAGHLLTGDSCLQQGEHFLSPSAKHIRISPLQADHRFPLLRLLNQQPVDFLLRSGPSAIPLSHIDPLAVRPRPVQKLLRRKAVIKQNIAAFHQRKPLHRDQLRPSAARSHQPDLSCFPFSLAGSFPDLSAE